MNLEGHKQELPASADSSTCQKVGHLSSGYIVPMCSCSSECIYKLGNRENLCVKQLVLESLDMPGNLEHSKIDESSAAIKTVSRSDSNGEMVKSQSTVVFFKGKHPKREV